MSQFMLLIYAPAGFTPTPEQIEAEMPKWFAYNQALRDAGLWLAGEQLQPVDTGKTVRRRDGELLVTDGPFAETRELLGGYYLIDAPDQATALEWAAKIPLVDYGSVEVREILAVPSMG